MEQKAIHNRLQHGNVDAALIDLEQLADAICEEMKGQCARQEIRAALEQILPHYQDARIWGFVPILMRREVTELLTGKTLPSSRALPA